MKKASEESCSRGFWDDDLSANSIHGNPHPTLLILRMTRGSRCRPRRLLDWLARRRRLRLRMSCWLCLLPDIPLIFLGSIDSIKIVRGSRRAIYRGVVPRRLRPRRSWLRGGRVGRPYICFLNRSHRSGLGGRLWPCLQYCGLRNSHYRRFFRLIDDVVSIVSLGGDLRSCLHVKGWKTGLILSKVIVPLLPCNCLRARLLLDVNIQQRHLFDHFRSLGLVGEEVLG